MPTKTRNTVVPYTSNYVAKYRKNPSPAVWNTAGSPSSGDRPALSGSLEGFTGRDGRMRPCLHAKYSHEYSRWTEGVTLKAPGTYNVEYEPEEYMIYTISPPSWPSVPGLLTDQQWSDKNTVALNAMLPSLSDSFSLINFLIELKDFRRLKDAFSKRKNRLKAAILGDGRGDKSLRRAFKDRPLASLSSAYLQYSFAWRPFVSDLMSMWEKLNSVEAELREIWERQGQPQTRHYSRPLSGYDQEPTYEPDWDETFDTRTDQFARVHRLKAVRSWYYKVVPSYHATCRYTYKTPGALDLVNRTKGWLDAFGIRLDPSIVWNAIPFTFIIDWVVDVGGFLRQYSSDNLGLRFTIEDFCSSLKYSTSTTTSVVVERTNLNNSITASEKVDMSRHERTVYERRIGIPSLTGALVGSELTWREASLGGALVIANRRPTS